MPYWFSGELAMGCSMKKKQIALWVLVGLVGIAMLAGIVAILLPQQFMDYRVMFTVGTVGVYAFGGLIIVAVSGQMQKTFRACATLLFVSMVVFVSMIWFDSFLDWQTEDGIYRSNAVILFVGILLAHRMLVFPLATPVALGKIAKRSALISAMLLCGLSSLGMLADGFGGLDDIAMRLMVIFAIVAAGTTFAAGAIALFGPKPEDDEPRMLAKTIEVCMQCPVCKHDLRVKSNTDGCCGFCNLKLRVEAEEMYCECGYLLYHLQSDVCPECGKAVEAGERWASAESRLET